MSFRVSQHTNSQHTFKAERTLQDLRSLIASHPKGVVVDCFAAWCGHCQALEPRLEKAYEKAASNDQYRPIVAINADTGILKRDLLRKPVPPQCGNLYTKLQVIVKGYPTVIKIVQKGDGYVYERWEGLRETDSDSDSLLDFAKI